MRMRRTCACYVISTAPTTENLFVCMNVAYMAMPQDGFSHAYTLSKPAILKNEDGVSCLAVLVLRRLQLYLLCVVVLFSLPTR